ncbi:Cytoplasmic tRNA 2-thiolation protein 2 [Coemansia biformis]|uniref:Cytoplasmic tRNA 2-thiolation protein 2 n=1 Tax=Coemansia biformis TaxID=1286918 RepID=A0A9W7Y6U7_9FUNG|nr:Cytoplasmic tRNA 2-thiolation protein 2 [Coemansia biformis]
MCDAPVMPAAVPARERRALVPNKCVKCKAARPHIAIRRILYCKPCFVQASVAKFRATHSRPRKNAGHARTRTMVAFSGGAASSALLRLAADYQHLERRGTDAEPPYAGLVVGHVDETSLFPCAPEEAIRAAAAATGLACVTAALEDAFAPGGARAALAELVHTATSTATDGGHIYTRLVRPGGDVTSRARLAALFAGLDSATDREDMLDIIKTALIVDMARRAGCGAVLMGDSATRVATKAMALVSRGRGFSLPVDVGTEVQWLDDLAVHRPMRDFLAKEIAFFNRWTGQRDIAVPGLVSGQPRGASIGRLAEAFVVELDQGFASTVSTVCRTLQKLEPSEAARSAPPCALCGAPAESDAQEWRSRITIGGTDVQPPPPPSLLDIGPALCYSCQGLLHRTAPGTALPGFCAARLEAGDRREALRRQIDECFIRDDCDAAQ